MRIVYSRHYNIGFFGVERLHPFDSRKYGRAWKRLKQAIGPRLRELHVRPPRQVRRDDLLAVHSADYLDRLRNSTYVAQALELPPVRYLPWRVVDHCVLRPMRWATMGTMIAAEKAVQCGFAVNLSGGYHHAKADSGEGFCIYSDIALAVHNLREKQAIRKDDRVVYVDLDAHQGNGVCHIFRDDDRVFIFDMYNSTIYPCFDTEARSRIDCDIPLTGACTEREYLHELKSRLPGFLDSVARSRPIGLAIYNAGTDVFEGDQLGGLRLSDQGILQRDLFTIAELHQRHIPTIMLLSGGYSAVSYRLVADSVQELINRYGGI